MLAPGISAHNCVMRSVVMKLTLGLESQWAVSWCVCVILWCVRDAQQCEPWETVSVVMEVTQFTRAVSEGSMP